MNHRVQLEYYEPDDASNPSTSYNIRYSETAGVRRIRIEEPERELEMRINQRIFTRDKSTVLTMGKN